MVKLTLTPHRGNGARTFPSTGFLGMTPVTLAGVVRVKIEEDLKTVEASSLVVRVRCYESLGTGGAPSTSTTKERRSSASAAANGGSSSSYHSSSCLGGASSSSTSHSSSYSFSDLFKGGAPSSTSSSNANSGSTSNAKGRVLYEKSIQMWSPPISPTITTTSASGTSTPLSSRSSSQDTSPPHAYPPRSRDTSTSSSSDSSGSSEKYATLGDFTKAWRIVIPINAVEQGAKSTMIFKNWRIWWAVEAVISHRPLGIHGDKIIKSHQVALLSYSPLPSSSNTPLSWISSPTNPHPLSYDITTPLSALGSSDPITFDVKLAKKTIMAETPKKVVIELRREICFCSGGVDGATSSSKEVIQNHQPSKDAIPKHNSTAARLAKHARSSSGGGLLSNIIAPPPVAHTKYKSESTEALIITPPPLSNASTMSSLSTYMPATPPSNIPTPGEYTDATSESYFGVFSKSSSHAKQQQHHHQYQHTYVPPPPIPITLPSSITRSQSHNHSHDNGNNKKRKDELTTLATFEIDCLFTNSNWQGKIKSSLPKSKSIYHYALGETCSTLFANSKFYLVPKIQYKNQKNFIELQKVEIFLSIVSNEERKKAIEMKGKILAIQKAEARLFGGDDEHIENGKNDQSYNERQRKQPANIARSTHTLKGTSSSSNSSDQQKVRPTSQSSRIRISQSVSPKVGTGGIASASASSSPQVNASETEEDDMPRLSTVRRRSEQGDLSLETPSRTRQRFGSTSDLSPVVGSPYLNTVSPSLSVISSSTSRPRTANGRSRPTTANSTKSITSFAGIGASRPKSSAGLEHAATSSAWSTFSNASTANFTVDPAAAVAILQISSSQTTNTASSSALSSCTPSSCTPSEPPSLSSKTSSSGSITSSIDLSPKSCSSGKDNLFPEQKLDTLKIENPFQYSPVTPAAVNGLFADFSGFSLRPPVISLSDTNTSIKKEESIHPRAMFPHDKISSYKRNSSHKVAVTLEKPSSIPGMVTNNKRKSGEVMDYALEEEEVGSLHDSSAASSNSSPVIALHEVTLASPPASVNMNPNNASQNSFLSPMTIQHNARSTSMKKIGSHDSHASSSINAPMGMSVHSKQQQQDVGLGSPKRGKGGMSGAFAFFRRSSTRT